MRVARARDKARMRRHRNFYQRHPRLGAGPAAGYNSRVQARFLFGPAGSGKTRRVLAAIRAALAADPAGPPLLLLAPKQATFQLERQMLEAGGIAGWSRLVILSFERLAQFVLEALARPPARLLPAQGRDMVLRALLDRLGPELEIFHGSARLGGFARDLADLVRECRRHGHNADRLQAAACRVGDDALLAAKLRDLARLLAGYDDWLHDHALADVETLPDLAAAALREAGAAAPALAAELWLDGFAEMTPQELDLLAAFAPFCTRMHLAFCLEAAPAEEPGWLSPWNLVAAAARSAHARLAALPGTEIAVTVLPRDRTASRYAAAPALRHLEAQWCAVAPKPFAGPPQGLRLVAAAHAEDEAVVAAREILAHVRAGGRFRDCAVLLRTLDGHHDALRRVFTRYGIPFFLDRREPLAHHPLAELTRGAVRTVALGWEHADWFGALKSGLAGADDETVDALENEALARGLRGEAAWLKSWSGPGEQSRARVVRPFAEFRRVLGPRPDGATLARALRVLWHALHVQPTLEAWSAAPAGGAGEGLPEGIHRGAWEQLQTWADGLALGFGAEPQPLTAWLPVLEAGLATLTAGVIPPAQDQVLIGAVDRARQPELRLVILAGCNDGLFPAAPAARGLLSERERDALAAEGLTFGPALRRRLGHERYYLYIALTRARERLVITYSRRDAEDRALNPSPFLASLRRLFPGLEVEEAPGPFTVAEALHPGELAPAFVASPVLIARLLPAGGEAERWRRLAGFRRDAALIPALAARLAGPVLRTSATRLEDYARCPFRFLAAHLFGAAPREILEADPRREGTLRHEILRAFTARWTAAPDLAAPLKPEQAAAWLDAAAADVLARPDFALWRDDALAAARAGEIVAQLRLLARAIAAWTATNAFRPAAAEWRFGPGGALPAWTLALPDGRAVELTGSVDRADTCRAAGGCERLVVYDYKTRARKPDTVLAANGIELQLTLYLAVLEDLLRAQGRATTAAGAFYVPLRPARPETDDEAEPHARFQCEGFAAADARPLLDSRDGSSGQFKWNTRDGRMDLAPEALADRLDAARALVRQFAVRLFAGDCAVAPYRHRDQTACDWCELRPVCRHEPATDGFRSPALHPPA